METLTMNPTLNLTLAQLDAEQDFYDLEQAIESARPGGCRTIEFFDDNTNRGYRALEYKVEVVVAHDHDEDGWAPRYEWTKVSVKVRDTTTVYSIVALLMGEINHLIES